MSLNDIFGNEDFDAVKESGTPKPKLKKGDNLVTIFSAELKNNKGGTGKYIEVLLVDSEGAQAKSFFNVQHTTKKAQDIGRSQFKNLCVSAGINGWPSELDQLIGKEVIVSISLEPDSFMNDAGEKIEFEKAIVKGFKKVEKAIASTVQDDDDHVPF